MHWIKTLLSSNNYTSKTSAISAYTGQFDHRSVDASLNPSVKNINSNDMFGSTNTSLFAKELSSNITNYEYGHINKGTTLDLSSYKNLKAVKIGYIEGNLKFPSTLTKFTCTVIEKSSTIDLSPCVNLTKVEVGFVFGILKLPVTSTLASFVGEWIEKDVNIDLSLCTNLKEVKVSHIYGSLQLPLNSIT